MEQVLDILRKTAHTQTHTCTRTRTLIHMLRRMEGTVSAGAPKARVCLFCHWQYKGTEAERAPDPVQGGRCASGEGLECSGEA